MVVEPGDLVVGDSDGVLAAPFDGLAELLEAARATQAAEEKRMAAIKAGSVDCCWVDRTLEASGCVWYWARPAIKRGALHCFEDVIDHVPA